MANTSNDTTGSTAFDTSRASIAELAEQEGLELLSLDADQTTRKVRVSRTEVFALLIDEFELKRTELEIAEAPMDSLVETIRDQMCRARGRLDRFAFLAIVRDAETPQRVEMLFTLFEAIGSIDLKLAVPKDVREASALERFATLAMDAVSRSGIKL